MPETADIAAPAAPTPAAPTTTPTATAPAGDGAAAPSPASEPASTTGGQNPQPGSTAPVAAGTTEGKTEVAEGNGVPDATSPDAPPLGADGTPSEAEAPASPSDPEAVPTSEDADGYTAEQRRLIEAIPEDFRGATHGKPDFLYYDPSDDGAKMRTVEDVIRSFSHAQKAVSIQKRQAEAVRQQNEQLQQQLAAVQSKQGTSEALLNHIVKHVAQSENGQDDAWKLLSPYYVSEFLPEDLHGLNPEQDLLSEEQKRAYLAAEVRAEDKAKKEIEAMVQQEQEREQQQKERMTSAAAKFKERVLDRLPEALGIQGDTEVTLAGEYLNAEIDSPEGPATRADVVSAAYALLGDEAGDLVVRGLRDAFRGSLGYGGNAPKPTAAQSNGVPTASSPSPGQAPAATVNGQTNAAPPAPAAPPEPTVSETTVRSNLATPASPPAASAPAPKSPQDRIAQGIRAQKRAV